MRKIDFNIENINEFIDLVVDYVTLSHHKYYKEYSESTQNTMDKIIKYGNKLKQSEWENIWKENRDNSVVLYALSQNKYTPKDIRTFVANETIKKYKTEKHKQDITCWTLMNCLKNTIPDTVKLEIIDLIKNEIFRDLGKYGYDNSMHEETNSIWGNKPCPYDEYTLRCLCDIYLSAKKWQKDIEYSPFRHIKDNKYIQEVMNSPKCTEKIYTAIANNCYISYDLRLQASQNADIEKVYYATLEMKEEIYKLATETYLEMPLNPKTRSKYKTNKEDIRAYNKALNFLCNKIRARWLPECMEIDLVNRIEALHNGLFKDYVLQTLFQHTTSERVLETAERMNKNADVLTAYSNENMNQNTRKLFVDTMLKQMAKKGFAPNNESRRYIITQALQSMTFNEKDYECIMKTMPYFTHQQLAESTKTPRYILKDIVDKTNEKIKKQTADQLDKDIYFKAQTHLMLSQSFSPQQCKEILQCISNFYITSEFINHRTNDQYTRKSIDGQTIKNMYAHYAYKNLGQALSEASPEDVENFKKNIKEHIKIQDNYSFQQITFLELLNIVNVAESTHKASSILDFKKCCDAELEETVKDHLYDVSESIDDDPIKLYENIKIGYQKFLIFQDEIQYREIESKKEIEETEYRLY